MALPHRAGSPPKPAKGPNLAMAPTTRVLKKGEILFSEGEGSRAMYFVKSGMIRIFKKKGNSVIEIDTVRSGSILGELAFLDGNPRSASGEALTDCILVEISGHTFTDTMQRIPDWLKLLLKTVVGRLRVASTRIRQLEVASTAFDYSDKGNSSKHYVYLNIPDTLKIATALLLVGSRSTQVVEGKGIEIRSSLLQRYANNIMGVPVAKITTFLDIMNQCDIVKVSDDASSIHLTQIGFLEEFVTFLNEENLLEPSKRHDVSLKGFKIMSLMVKYMGEFPLNPATGQVTINLAMILQKEKEQAGGKEPFRADDFPEIVKIGYATQLTVKSSTEMTTEVIAEEFARAFKLQRVMKTIDVANEQKAPR